MNIFQTLYSGKWYLPLLIFFACFYLFGIAKSLLNSYRIYSLLKMVSCYVYNYENNLSYRNEQEKILRNKRKLLRLFPYLKLSRGTIFYEFKRICDSLVIELADLNDDAVEDVKESVNPIKAAFKIISFPVAIIEKHGYIVKPPAAFAINSLSLFLQSAISGAFDALVQYLLKLM